MCITIENLLQRHYIFLADALKAAGKEKSIASYFRLAYAGKIPALKVEGRWLVPEDWAARLITDPPKRGRPKETAEHKRAVRARIARDLRRRQKEKAAAASAAPSPDDGKGTAETSSE